MREKEAFLKAGADSFISKPNSYTDLKNILRDLLKNLIEKSGT